MDIEQIDLSCDFAKLQNAGEKKKREIYNRIADKLEHVFSILNYQDTQYSNETRNEQIYGKKSCSNINTVSQADAKDQNSQHPKDDLKSTGNALVEILRMKKEKRAITPSIIEQIFGKNELKDPLEQSFLLMGKVSYFQKTPERNFVNLELHLASTETRSLIKTLTMKPTFPEAERIIKERKRLK